MVTLQDWDSIFFGYSIGKILIKKENDFDLKCLKVNSSHFKLIYVFSDHEITPSNELKLVDIKVLLSKTCESQKIEGDIIEFNSELHSYDQLLDLAFLSGSYSRYRLDENFKNDEFKKLYKEWLDKSIGKIISDKVFINQCNDKLSGFVTLDCRSSKNANIGLIAVNSSCQGRNIGSRLIKTCENYAFANGCDKIEVCTQKNNEAAMKLYKKNGFEVNNVQYIYHLWNK